MKQAHKKLLGITVIGMSAWLLAIALVLFDNTTKAMLSNEPLPANGASQPTADDGQPRTLGASSTPSDTTLRTTSDRSAPIGDEAQAATLMQAPATNFAHAGHNHDEAGTLGTQATGQPKSNLITFMAITGAVLLAAGATLAIVSFRRKQTK